MAKILRPKRGKKTSAEGQELLLEKGEIFFEVPEGGDGSGTGKIKMGDGNTKYADLPYFMGKDTEDIILGNTVVGKATTATKAGTATYASNSGTSTYSSNSAKASSATSATYATTSTKAGSASTATVDSGGLNINQNYIKNATVSGKVVTFTKGNGSTFSITTQDTDTNTDTKVTQTATTASANYPLLLAPSGTTATTTTTAYFDSGVTLNPNTNTIAANVSGSAAKATSATSATYSSTAVYAKSAPTYKGATTAASGTVGLVPIATTATRTNFLRGDGTWAVPSKATSATSATYATTATKAGTATYATNSGTASYSSNGAKATSATYATTATKAGTATYATKAGTATYASNIANNLTTTGSGYALDATQGKALNDKFGKVLWTNTNPVAFDTMTITLSSSDYDVLDIYWLWNTTLNNMYVTSCLKGHCASIKGCSIVGNGTDNPVAAVLIRETARNSNTSFTVNSILATNSNYGNNYLIPYKVVGRKLS